VRPRRKRARLDTVENALATLAHEIRTPLNGILALSELIAAAELPEREREWARLVKSAAEHLANLATLVVDGVRAEARGLALRDEPFHPRALAEAVGGMLAARAEAKGLAASIVIAADLPELVTGDRVRLRAALENLADNAVKFTEAGQVGFSVASAPSRGRHRLTFTVTDSDNNRADFHTDPSPTPGQPNDAVNFTVTSLTPDDALQSTGATGITVVGTDFAPTMKAIIGTGTTSCVVNTSTNATCSALSNAAVAKVNATFQNPLSVGAPDVVLPGAFTYTGKLNETNTAPEADYCVLQFPSSFSVTGGQTTAAIYGQIFEAGVTEAPGAAAGVLAEVGYGNSGSDPTGTTATSWRFFPMTYNVQAGNNDEYMGSFVAPTVTASTNYAYTVRFSFDNGLNWTYCDTDGAGSNTGVDFSATKLGAMTVTP